MNANPIISKHAHMVKPITTRFILLFIDYMLSFHKAADDTSILDLRILIWLAWCINNPVSEIIVKIILKIKCVPQPIFCKIPPQEQGKFWL